MLAFASPLPCYLPLPVTPSRHSSRPISARLIGASPTTRVRILTSGSTWVAIDKPANLLVHRNESLAKGERAFVVEELRKLLPETPADDVRVVHRLDRPTSGVMVFAVGATADAAALQKALEDAEKEYWVVVRAATGVVAEDAWVNDRALKKPGDKRKGEGVVQEARTEFRKLAKFRMEDEWLEEVDGFEEHEIAVLEARLGSGRRHQIRRHLSNSKMPVVEDTSYGKGKFNRDMRVRYGTSRLALHSRRLTFRDPGEGGELVVIEAPVPQDLREVLQRVPGYDAELHADMCDMGSLPVEVGL